MSLWRPEAITISTISAFSQNGVKIFIDKFETLEIKKFQFEANLICFSDETCILYQDFSPVFQAFCA